MNKKQLFTLLYVILIIFVIGTCIYMISWIKSESAMCMKDPINWFEEKNEGASCSCYKDGVQWPYTSTNQYQNKDFSDIQINP